MTEQELEVMIARIDVQTANTHALVEKQALQLEKINGTVDTHSTDIAALKEAKKNQSRWLGGLTAAIVAVTIGVVTNFITRITGK